MKKLFSILAPLLVSLFLYPSIVSASEYTGTISSDYFDYDSDGSYTTLKTYVDNYMQQNNLSYYVIIYIMDWNNGIADFNQLTAYVYSSSPTYSFNYESTSKFNLYSGTSSSRIFTKYKGNNNISNKNGAAFYNVNFFVADATYGTTYMIIDTNIDFIYTGSNTYNFGSSYGTFSVSNGVRLKGLVEIANSTPPDDTPILTNYYTLIFDKLGVLTNYFKNNPYLYAIPLIPIFILCIYLIKRSLIK